MNINSYIQYDTMIYINKYIMYKWKNCYWYIVNVCSSWKYLLFHENLEIRIFWLFTSMLFDKKTNVIVKNIAFIISEWFLI